MLHKLEKQHGAAIAAELSKRYLFSKDSEEI